MIQNETFALSNGVRIPAIAFGTWQMQGDEARTAVKEAIGCGYRHIDTAQITATMTR